MIAAGYERRMCAAAGATGVLIRRRTMRKKQVIKVCLVLCCTTGMALGQPYSRTGASGFNNLWGNSFN